MSLPTGPRAGPAPQRVKSSSGAKSSALKAPQVRTSLGPVTLVSGAGAPARLFPASSIGPHKSIASEFLVLPDPVQGFSSSTSWGVSRGPEAVWLSYPVCFSHALIPYLSCRECKSSHSICIQKTSFSSTLGSLQSSGILLTLALPLHHPRHPQRPSSPHLSSKSPLPQCGFLSMCVSGESSPWDPGLAGAETMAGSEDGLDASSQHRAWNVRSAGTSLKKKSLRIFLLHNRRVDICLASFFVAHIYKKISWTFTWYLDVLWCFHRLLAKCLR